MPRGGDERQRQAAVAKWGTGVDGREGGRLRENREERKEQP